MIEANQIWYQEESTEYWSAYHIILKIEYGAVATHIIVHDKWEGFRSKYKERSVADMENELLEAKAQLI
jgi:hypothetical protein